ANFRFIGTVQPNLKPIMSNMSRILRGSLSMQQQVACVLHHEQKRGMTVGLCPSWSHGGGGNLGFNNQEQPLVIGCNTRHVKTCFREECEHVPIQMTSPGEALPHWCQPILQPPYQRMLDPHMLEKQRCPWRLTDAPHLAQRLPRIRNRTGHQGADHGIEYVSGKGSASARATITSMGTATCASPDTSREGSGRGVGQWRGDHRASARSYPRQDSSTAPRGHRSRGRSTVPVDK